MCRRDRKSVTCAHFELQCAAVDPDKEVGPQERLSLHNSESRRLLINFVGESSLPRVSGGGWSREGPGGPGEVQGSFRDKEGDPG